MSEDHDGHSRAGPWICVAVMIVGFIAGAVLFIARAWWPFAVSCAVVIAAGLISLKVGIMQDTRTGRFDQPSS